MEYVLGKRHWQPANQLTLYPTHLEANYNLLLKWFGAHGFLAKSEYADRLTNAQGGGHKGQSAIDLACKIVVTYDVCRITKDKATIVGNNLAECFDRMIENCHNLSC